MNTTFQLTSLLTCAVCKEYLTDPISLSCGYTVCRTCLPPSTLLRKPTFVCPVSQCTSKAHLFGPQLFTDACVHGLSQLTRNTIDCYSRPPTPTSMDDGKNSLAIQNIQQGDHVIQSSTAMLQCHCCSQTMVNPITTHCGHTFCRLCVLQMKVTTDKCLNCKRPLPKFASLEAQAPNYLLESVKRGLQSAGAIRSLFANDSPFLSVTQWHETDIPLFTNGSLVLPNQPCRFPIFTAPLLRQMRHAIVSSSRYNGLCMAVVHQGLPSMAQFGTIVKIISVEHRHDAIIIDAIGLDRFKIEKYHQIEEDCMVASIEVLVDDEIVPRVDDHLHCSKRITNNANDDYAQALIDFGFMPPTYDTASTLHQRILDMVQSSPTPSLNISTEGLLGPVWFENMQQIYGPLPSPKEASRLCWWVASVLPGSNTERYAFLSTDRLSDRLETAILWINQLESQWTRCRSSAVHAISQAILQQQ
ncbi:hypothetical protein J3Q64DRAFT_1774395 [Phycomyces blakesleeanus]|uniref:RING-type domain-containing protein n=2 Tax=Phycomyces blakesleeanus TaxID=4837 RepID=A0A162Y937_PHYB8|nr:hypothetical protein PHYBLDRAFT_76978 [Phycomyces blakesleeanus NRRL 1555(-)]OAD79085.1 hypothetical protein PHYBLDRAFT_76978 [Phycomyces blakesleeanus NRRL 1555(-)]CRI62799.1 LON peptidase N-terminal domain and Ring Finger similar to CrgA [Phycomyces blakesleeanus]|eukprot:XP_018297125.1 hypothetical protein PHYBLDRAFT_76978 [Phycomyces blakesleeanus NRRL 1555(-)]